MQNIKPAMKRVQELTQDAYLVTGRLMALAGEDAPSPVKLAQTLDETAAQFEKSVVELRNICESYRPRIAPLSGKEQLRPAPIQGCIDQDDYGWVHIRLDTLLPHCRLQPPLFIRDTIIRLLDRYEREAGPLPRYEQALLIIDEHCDITNRQVYDNDNKGWKAVSNALKGRLFTDDDQFTLSVCLLATRSSEACCHIYVLEPRDAPDFFALRVQ